MLSKVQRVETQAPEGGPEASGGMLGGPEMLPEWDRREITSWWQCENSASGHLWSQYLPLNFSAIRNNAFPSFFPLSPLEFSMLLLLFCYLQPMKTLTSWQWRKKYTKIQLLNCVYQSYARCVLSLHISDSLLSVSVTLLNVYIFNIIYNLNDVNLMYQIMSQIYHLKNYFHIFF